MHAVKQSLHNETTRVLSLVTSLKGIPASWLFCKTIYFVNSKHHSAQLSCPIFHLSARQTLWFCVKPLSSRPTPPVLSLLYQLDLDPGNESSTNDQQDG
jgi:hypothetical protein